jgi:hypothetical protein
MTDTKNDTIDPATDKSVAALVDIGRIWAAHGLGIGKRALLASAETLRITAETLADISDRVAKKDDDAPKAA